MGCVVHYIPVHLCGDGEWSFCSDDREGPRILYKTASHPCKHGVKRGWMVLRGTFEVRPHEEKDAEMTITVGR